MTSRPAPTDHEEEAAEGNGAPEPEPGGYDTAEPADRGVKPKPVPPVITPAEAKKALDDGIAAANATNGNGTHPKPMPAVGRSLPHSIEAEEALLGSCLVVEDQGAILAKAKDAGIRRDSFYDQKHGIIWEMLLRMAAAKKPIEASVLAEELKSTGQLDAIGGYAFITQITDSQPTTLMAEFFIESVREKAIRRDIIRAATSAVEDCYTFTSDLPGLTADLKRRLDFAASFPRPAGQRMDWDALMAFDPKRDPDCLMGNRFLGRTGAIVIVAPSGVGKSVLGFQFGANAALGRHFFGMKMHLAMRVLYIQAEDDFGDVAEAVQGFARGHGISPDELAQLRIRLRIERWNDVAGDRFLSRLRRFYDEWPFDFVIINPLFAFAGCNVSEQRELSPFLRNSLNVILNETRAAAAVIHHTNKPPQDPTAQDKAVGAELRYLGSGSAELTNWARSYITLQGVRSAGDHVHKMTFVKRGTRTGIVDAEGKPTNSVYVEHSKTGLCWLPSDYSPDPSGKYQNRFDLLKALAVYDSKKHWTENEILIARALEMDPRSVRRHRQEIEERG